METVRVVVSSNIGEDCLRSISAVNQQVELVDAAGLVRAAYAGDKDAESQLDTVLAGAEIVYGLHMPRNLLRRTPSLKWVQVMSAGVEWILDDDMRESNVLLTNVSGIHAIPISEYVLTMMLTFSKQVPLWLKNNQDRKWQRFPLALLRGQTAGIVGLGSIGQEIARLAHAFGMRVMATRRRASGTGHARNVDIILPQGGLEQLLRESDFVVLAVPLTPETEKLIGEAELRLMKPAAILINIARGKVVDEEALARALKEGWIAGAGLDVFETEPLPAASKLWGLPNVILTSHISGGMGTYAKEATAIFCRNLERYFGCRRLLNLVDKKKGY